MAELADDKPEGWGGRPDRGDGGLAAGTNGALSVTSGWRGLRNAYLAIGAVIVLVAGVNIATILDDARRIGEAMPVRVPIVLEVTSGLATYLACVVVYLAVSWAPPGRRPWALTLATHLGASLVFSGLHVGLMELMRWAAFASLGVAHRWSPAEMPYEYRKDAVSYLALAFAFWAVTRQGPATIARAASEPNGAATFDIKDGAATLRTPVGDILAAQAAGNYVEFVLEGGGRPLMRASLGEIEKALAPHGLVRTHRSWLVNERRIRALVAAGSGDFRLDLDGGVSVPLSRRFPEALARLRGGR